MFYTNLFEYIFYKGHSFRYNSFEEGDLFAAKQIQHTHNI